MVSPGPTINCTKAIEYASVYALIHNQTQISTSSPTLVSKGKNVTYVMSVNRQLTFCFSSSACMSLNDVCLVGVFSYSNCCTIYGFSDQTRGSLPIAIDRITEVSVRPI